jgi:hypothetical protein
MSERKVGKALLDEAIRLGEISSSEALLHVGVNKLLVAAIGEALALIRSGRAAMARDTLDAVLRKIEKMVKQS